MTPRTDPGSFRDRESRVFYRDGRVLRGLSAIALGHFEALEGTRFYQQGLENGSIVGTRRVEVTNDLLEDLGTWEGALEHDRIPFVSYPYEWSFGMLRRAAELQLELLLAALDEGMTLKDASSYNIQWVGSRPVFIDISSFEVWKRGEPWIGYQQFCQLYLYPLLLTAYKDVSFHPWLRGAIDGIEPEEMAALLSGRDLLRPGVLPHVRMLAAMKAKAADRQASTRAALEDAGFGKELIQKNASGLLKLVRKLEWKRSTSTWADYAEQSPYSDEDRERKRQFVGEVAGSERWAMTWDLGANTGEFSRIAARHSDYVLAMDSDHLAVDRLFTELEADQEIDNILPLVVNLASPSPGSGWRGAERQPLLDRPNPDLILALALTHHLVISSNVPVVDLLDWLHSLGGHLLLEFVTKDDPMPQKLLLNKEDNYDDYEIEAFEEAFEYRFHLLRKEPLCEGRRILYFARPR